MAAHSGLGGRFADWAHPYERLKSMRDRKVPRRESNSTSQCDKSVGVESFCGGKIDAQIGAMRPGKLVGVAFAAFVITASLPMFGSLAVHASSPPAGVHSAQAELRAALR